jgi:hypothetical protein
MSNGEVQRSQVLRFIFDRKFIFQQMDEVENAVVDTKQASNIREVFTF